jgi:uncharacterized protein
MPARQGLARVDSFAVPAHQNPYAISVLDLMRHPGDMRERELDVAATEGFGNALIGVPAGATIRIDARLESLHEGVLVSADVEAPIAGECSRCLDPIAYTAEVEFQELFAYSEDEAFDYTVADESVDLEPLVRESVVMSLPFQPVCRPDCPGLDPETGERLADRPDIQPREVLDPRWSALQSFHTDTDGADSTVETEER